MSLGDGPGQVLAQVPDGAVGLLAAAEDALDVELPAEPQHMGRGLLGLVGGTWRHLPHVAFDDIAWRIRWCVFGPVGALLTDESAAFARPADDLVEELARTLSAALAA